MLATGTAKKRRIRSAAAAARASETSGGNDGGDDDDADHCELSAVDSMTCVVIAGTAYIQSACLPHVSISGLKLKAASSRMEGCSCSSAKMSRRV